MTVLTRRGAIQMTFGAAALMVSPAARADFDLFRAALKDFDLAGAEESDRVIIDAPSPAENGNQVAFLLEVDPPKDDPVTRLALLTSRNPWPLVFSAALGPQAAPRFRTRIRLAKSQWIMGVAETASGARFARTALVEVTLGGCGG